MSGEPSKTKRRGIAAVRILCGVGGIGAVAWLVHRQGADNVASVLLPALPWLPLATGLKLATIAMDAVSTRYTLGDQGKAIPRWALYGSHLVAYAVMGVAPAGRATAEAVKAGLLARWIGMPAAIAVGTANQANVFLSTASFSALCAAASWSLTGSSLLTWALVAHAVGLNLAGLALRAAARWPRAAQWLAKKIPRVAGSLSTFQQTSRATALYPVKPVGSMMLGRAFQAAEFGVLAIAVGLAPSVVSALVLHGVHLVVAAVAVLVPGQLGAAEGGFTWSATLLGISETQALSIALLAHLIQLGLVGVGFFVLILWPGRQSNADS